MFESDAVTNRDEASAAAVPGSCTIEEARLVPEVEALLAAAAACRTLAASSVDAAMQRSLVVGLTAAVATTEAARFEAIGSLAGSGAWEADG